MNRWIWGGVIQSVCKWTKTTLAISHRFLFCLGDKDSHTSTDSNTCIKTEVSSRNTPSPSLNVCEAGKDQSVKSHTCAKVTLVNFLCSSLARFRAFGPGLRGRSILGVLIFALAVIKISLKCGNKT